MHMLSITHTPPVFRDVLITRSAYQKLVISAKNTVIKYQLHYEINIGSHVSLESAVALSM